MARRSSGLKLYYDKSNKQYFTFYKVRGKRKKKTFPGDAEQATDEFNRFRTSLSGTPEDIDSTGNIDNPDKISSLNSTVSLADEEDRKYSIAEIADKFLCVDERRYRKGQLKRNTFGLHSRVIRFTCKRFGATLANKFTPRNLDELRELIIQDKLRKNGKQPTRAYINYEVSVVKKMFKFAVSKGYCDTSVLVGLNAVDNIEEGETDLRELSTVYPIQEESLNRLLNVADQENKVVAAAIRLQRLTGMRSCELLNIRPCDIKKFDDGVWEYTVQDEYNKTRRTGKKRIVPIGKAGQEVLKPLLDIPETEFVFQYTPPRKSKRKLRYITYYRLFRKYAELAGIRGRVHPHQLRHCAADTINQALGIEAAQVTLGHTQVSTTNIYTDFNRTLAHKVAQEVG